MELRQIVAPLQCSRRQSDTPSGSEAYKLHNHRHEDVIIERESSSAALAHCDTEGGGSVKEINKFAAALTQPQGTELQQQVAASVSASRRSGWERTNSSWDTPSPPAMSAKAKEALRAALSAIRCGAARCRDVSQTLHLCWHVGLITSWRNSGAHAALAGNWRRIQIRKQQLSEEAAP